MAAIHTGRWEIVFGVKHGLLQARPKRDIRSQRRRTFFNHTGVAKTTILFTTEYKTRLGHTFFASTQKQNIHTPTFLWQMALHWPYRGNFEKAFLFTFIK